MLFLIELSGSVVVCFINCLLTNRSEPQMTSNLTAVILVQDTVGYKNDSVIKNKWKWYLGTSQSTVHVRRGELLKEYHHEEKKYNYVLQRDPSVFLRCADENVAPLLTQKEFMLMEGIEKPVDRFGAFIEGMIEFGMSLEPGSRVFVNIGTKDRRLIRAIVHYIGEVLGGQGCHFGVELKVSIILSDWMYLIFYLLTRVHYWNLRDNGNLKFLLQYALYVPPAYL